MTREDSSYSGGREREGEISKERGVVMVLSCKSKKKCMLMCMQKEKKCMLMCV